MSNLARRRRKSKAKYDEVDGGKNNGATAVWSTQSHSHHYSELTQSTRDIQNHAAYCWRIDTPHYLSEASNAFWKAAQNYNRPHYIATSRACLTPSFILLFKKKSVVQLCNRSTPNPTTKPNEILFKWKKWVLSMSVYTNFYLSLYLKSSSLLLIFNCQNWLYFSCFKKWNLHCLDTTYMNWILFPKYRPSCIM